MAPLDRLGPTEREVVLRFRAALEGTFGSRLLDVRLFGSRIYGLPRPDSDLDVFVLIDGATAEDLDAVACLAADVGAEGGVDLAPLVLAPDRYRYWIDLERAVVQDIRDRGLPV